MFNSKLAFYEAYLKMRKARKSGSKGLTKYLYDTPRKNGSSAFLVGMEFSNHKG
jgi:hypothetical protein